MATKKKTKGKIDYKHNLKEYWQIMRKYKILIFLLILFGIMNEAKSLGDRYLFKILIDKGTEFFTGVVLMGDFLMILSLVLILMGILILASMTSNFFRMHFLNRLDSSAMRDLKQKYFSHIIELDHGFHTTHKTGSCADTPILTDKTTINKTLATIFLNKILTPFIETNDMNFYQTHGQLL